MVVSRKVVHTPPDFQNISLIGQLRNAIVKLMLLEDMF